MALAETQQESDSEKEKEKEEIAGAHNYIICIDL